MEKKEQLPPLQQLPHGRIALMRAEIQARLDEIAAAIGWWLIALGDRWRTTVAGPSRSLFRESWLLRRPGDESSP